MREIRLICKKELSRVLTDRKMLFSIFLLPAIIMVVVMNVMTSFSENLENDVKSHAPIVYLQNAPEGVEQYLKAYNEKMDLRTVDDEQKVTEEIRDGSADLWIAFPQDFLEHVFNIKGNNYRLVVVIKFTIQFVYIRFIGTHKEYDRIDCANI